MLSNLKFFSLLDNCFKDFLHILHNEGEQLVDQEYVLTFSKKIFLWGKWLILGPKMAHGHNFGSVLRFFCKFCTIKEANRCIKSILMVLWKKSH